MKRNSEVADWAGISALGAIAANVFAWPQSILNSIHQMQSYQWLFSEQTGRLILMGLGLGLFTWASWKGWSPQRTWRNIWYGVPSYIVNCRFSQPYWSFSGLTPSISSYECSIGTVAKIRKNSDYGLDHNLVATNRKASLVEFVGSFTEDSWLYIKISLRDSRGNSIDNNWIQVRPGNGRPVRMSAREWLIYVEPEPVKREIEALRVPLSSVVKKTFGADGCKYDGVSGFRLRGDLDIHEIAVWNWPPEIKVVPTPNKERR